MGGERLFFSGVGHAHNIQIHFQRLDNGSMNIKYRWLVINQQNGLPKLCGASDVADFWHGFLINVVKLNVQH